MAPVVMMICWGSPPSPRRRSAGRWRGAVPRCRGQICHRAEGIEAAHAAAEGPTELGVGEEGRVRHRHAKGHQLP